MFFAFFFACKKKQIEKAKSFFSPLFSLVFPFYFVFVFLLILLICFLFFFAFAALFFKFLKKVRISYDLVDIRFHHLGLTASSTGWCPVVSQVVSIV